ncbi:MAG: hypothetical protein HUU22_07455 [Phycisphaerae bacterium]|nr:hypothetical protein [Phycisphaerae bacterium]NUQ45853.1 hypothetical protein [Phycisphaerae bacterium]
MLTVTAAALERLSQKLARRKAADDVSLRFRRVAGRWRLRRSRVRPDDATFSHKGRKVLLLDEATAKAMAALTLVVTDTEAGERLKLRKSKGDQR